MKRTQSEDEDADMLSDDAEMEVDAHDEAKNDVDDDDESSDEEKDDEKDEDDPVEGDDDDEDEEPSGAPAVSSERSEFLDAFYGLDRKSVV